ncbi:MAG: DUF4012 domain-containing protein [Candidatus Magasanikbacteria bacterium]
MELPGGEKQTKPSYEIPVYEDARPRNMERKKIDFAHLVRTANKGVVNTAQVEDTYADKTVGVDILKEIAEYQNEQTFAPVENSPEAIFRYSDPALLKKKKSNGFKVPKFNPFRSMYGAIIGVLRHVQDACISCLDHIHIKKFALSTLVFVLIAAIPYPALGLYRKVQSDTNKIIENSTNAFLSLQSSTVAVFHNNIGQAQFDLTSALQSFHSAEELLDKEYKALVYVGEMLPIVGTQIKSRQSLLLAGHSLALGNTYLVKGLSEATQDGEGTLISRLGIIKQHLRSAIPQYEQAVAYLQTVQSTAVPAEHQESFEDFKTLFGAFVSDMHEMDDIIESIQLMMGGEGFKRYLVIFQNQYELRPTGGFAGSFAVVDVQNGKVLNMEIPGGGTYDVQGQLDTFVKPPLPLQLLNKRWEFQDSNWFPDFPASAQKMAWFYQHSRNSTVDGVIAINASVLERLLRVLGPTYDAQSNVVFDADNALSQLEYQIQNYDNKEENKPKAILSVLLDQLLNGVSRIDAKQVVLLLGELSGALDEKEIQLYFSDERIQSLVGNYGWTGDIIDTKQNQDYFMLVDANIGGGKSNAQLKQIIEHQAVVQEDGSIIDTVWITRSHEGDNPALLYDEFNSSYIRMYVPEGSELLDAGGFTYPDEASFSVPPREYKEDIDLSAYEKEESIHVKTGTRITTEFGKTAFGNWIVTKPEEDARVYFTYKLPFTVSAKTISEQSFVSVASLLERASGDEQLSTYNVIFQKQSGSDSTIKHTVIYPPNWRPVWKTGDGVNVSVNGESFEKPFTEDIIAGVVMKKY